MSPAITPLYQAAMAKHLAGALDEAEALYRRILAMEPLQPETIQMLGALEQARENYPLALEYLDIAIELQPDSPEAHANLASLYRAMKQPQDAVSAYDRALALNPNLARAHYDRGDELWGLKRYAEADESIRRAIALDPAFRPLDDYNIFRRLKIGDWKNNDGVTERFGKIVRDGGFVDPFIFMTMVQSPADQLACARRYAQASYPPLAPLWTGEVYQHDRIRIGLLSADFHDHPVAHLLAGVIERFDRSRFELIGLSFGPDKPHPIRDRVTAACDQFHLLTDDTPAVIAQKVRDLEIDVAVSLNGYTRNTRPGILARRPAPVQVSYLGYPGTLGAPYVDYLIADEHALPRDETGFYDEKIVWMPDTYQPTDDRADIGVTPSREALGLPENAFVFFGYNQLYKVRPPMFDAWMRILGRVENSILWLTGGNGDEQAQRNVRAEAEARGVAGDRIRFTTVANPRAAYVARYRAADLFLDTLPYNAHSTASDALWAGLPVVTCAGEIFPGRVAKGLLTAVGMPELVTTSLQAYEDLAVRLATDPALMATTRARLAANLSTTPLFDTAAYTRHLETALETMHRRHVQGLAPESFRVEP